ncbi:MAG TPA: hypothetical protein VEC37_17775 [Bacillota bacterium]|nr:hypothetical protein [Bacillota bacterium]
MKRLLTLSLLTALTLGTVCSTWAMDDYNHIYYETVLTEETTYTGSEHDWKQYMITADVPLDKFKFGFEANYGEIELDEATDLVTEYLTYKIKGGLAVINSEQARFDLTGGYYKSDYETEDINYTINHESLFLGVDLRLMLSERVWLDASYLRGMNPVVKTDFAGAHNKTDMDNLESTNVRINFLLTEDTALSFGYMCEDLRSNASYAAAETNFKNKGYTVGLAYRF